ncbi:hypothetical protein CDD83_283 [Cordyceps sp. RAO-2017]|nr:hypothetical protein CDD83_283 [Cordyceps sp. RAO-2017]
MAVGRFVCVSVPLVLTIAAIISLLVATLSGVTHNSLYVFRVNISGLSVNPSSLGDLRNLVNIPQVKPRADLPAILGKLPLAGGNITAAAFGVGGVVDVNLWGFCTTDKDGKRECTKSQFDWASRELNTTRLEGLGDAVGVKVNLPNEVQDGLKAFAALAKWTEVAFIVALVALGIELVVGILSTFSRVISCLTWLTAGVTAVLVGVAAGLATAMGSLVVGTVEATARAYGVKGDIGGRFLAACWLAFAFATAAAFFWFFTICCCKPGDRRSRGGGVRHRDTPDGEKLMPSRAYAPIGNENEMSGGGFAHQGPTPSHPPRYPGGTGRADLAYEPYSHRV